MKHMMKIAHVSRLVGACLIAMSFVWNVEASRNERRDTYLSSENPTLPVNGVIFSHNTRLRALPSTQNTRVVDVLAYGTSVTIIGKAQDEDPKTKEDGRWFKVLTGSNKEGWVYQDFIISENADSLRDEIQNVVRGLWFKRPQLEAVVQKFKSTPPAEIKNAFKGIKPTALNYAAYHLMTIQHPNALPVLVEYLSQENKKFNDKDATYNLNWEIVSRLTPKMMLPLSYDAYTKFWEEHHGNYTFPLSKSDVFNLLVRIQQAELKAYKKG